MSDERPARASGSGLSALLGEAARRAGAGERERDARGGVREIEIARIRPNPTSRASSSTRRRSTSWRSRFAERGVLQPILLRPDGDGYEIIAGERRWRAAQRARLHTIPAIVRDIDEATTAEIALIENIQREDLNAIEEAEGYRQLIERHGHTPGRRRQARPQVAQPRRQPVEIARSSRVRAAIAIARRYQHGPCAGGRHRARSRSADPGNHRQGPVGAPGREPRAQARKRGQARSDIGRAERATRGRCRSRRARTQLGDMLGLKVQVAHKGAGRHGDPALSSLDQLDMICQRFRANRSKGGRADLVLAAAGPAGRS